HSERIHTERPGRTAQHDAVDHRQDLHRVDLSYVMTLVAGHAQHQGGPKTHAFIVGVGRYRHLLGGGDERPGIPALAQLTSPPISARGLADCLIGALNNPTAPLGSVELLLSEGAGKPKYLPPTPGATPITIERATSERIRGAFDRWYARCDAHKDNVALFY